MCSYEDRKIYYVGGKNFSDGEITNRVLMYDTKTQSCKMNSYLQKFRQLSSSTVVGRQIFVYGGYGRYQKLVDAIEFAGIEEDGLLSTWKQIILYGIEARKNAVVCATGVDELVIFGGRAESKTEEE